MFAGGFGGPGGRGGGGGGGGSSGGSGGSGAHVVAVSDDRMNSVVVSAPEGLMGTIEEMIGKVDQQVNDDIVLRVFRLKNADPAETADELAQLFPDPTASTTGNQNNNMPFFLRGGGRPGGGAAASTGPSDRTKQLGRVTAVPEPRTSSLLVSASKTIMPEIAHLIEELDSDQGKRETVGYYELKNADPVDVYQALQDLFNRNTVKMPANSQNALLSSSQNPLARRQANNSQATSSGTSALGTGSGSSAGGSSSFGH
jgi:hypothetical protein